MNEELVAILKTLFKGDSENYGLETPEGKDICKHAPLTDEVLLDHIEGKKRIGVYPIYDGDKINFASVDFDSVSEEKLKEFYATCIEANLVPHLVRSRGKNHENGIHAHLFFDEAIEASVVRRALNKLLKACLIEGEVFPKQDRIEENEFGNFIFLPLNGESLKCGRTAFLKSDFLPYSDQLAYIRNAYRTRVEHLVALAGTAEGKQSTGNQETHSQSVFDVGEYLQKYGIPFRIKSQADRTFFLLDKCFFSEAHTTGDNKGESAIVQGKDGKLTYFCFHAHCQGRTWAEARQIISGNERIAESPTIAKAIFEATDGEKSTIEIGIHLTDWGNAKRFVSQHGSRVRYCYTWCKFLVWDGHRYAVDDIGEINRMAKQTVASIYIEAGKEKDSDSRETLGGFALKCESESRIMAMIELVKSEPGVYVRPEELDRDAWLLNVENGTIDLKTGLLREPAREDLITKLAPVIYDPMAGCPLWTEHLTKIMVGKAHLINFLQRVFGYCLTGITGERAIFIAWGRGANGKSVTQETVSKVLGMDYADRTASETILIKHDGAIPNDVAKLRGMRFVYASEAEEGKKLAESLIKDLTGGDRISARFMRAEWFSFEPTFKLWLATNHKPIIHGTDNAIWDRIKLIPFTFTIPYDERIPHHEMFARFQPEHSGILAWMVKGCLEWQKMRLGTPEEVTAATSEYRSEMDLLGNFIRDYCETSKTAETSSKELYGGYLEWAEENKERPLSKRSFGASLTERGFTQGRAAKGARKWMGITLHG